MNRMWAVFILAWIPGIAGAGPVNEADFFNDDWETRVAEVSEGQLVWQAGEITAQTPRVTLEVELDPVMVASGWLAVRQCHKPLDAVSAAELVFTERNVRALKVLSHEHIDEVTIQGEKVELVGIAKGARICVASEQQIIHPLPGGQLAVIAGPYQRRFLDGYYPQVIDITLHYPAGGFQFERLHPVELGEHVNLQDAPGKLHFSAHVAGRLKFAFVFRPIQP